MIDTIYVQKIKGVWYIWATDSEHPRGAHMDDAIPAQTEQEAMDEAESMSQFEYEGEIEEIELLQEGENVEFDPDDPYNMDETPDKNFDWD